MGCGSFRSIHWRMPSASLSRRKTTPDLRPEPDGGPTRSGPRLLAATALLLLICAGGAAAPEGQAVETGTIAGRVRLTSRVRGTALPSNAYQPRAVHPRATPVSPEIKNVIIYVKGAARSPVAPVTREIRQEGEAFQPRVIAVPRGSTVTFPNLDPFYHNVFSLSGAATFDLGRYPNGKTRGHVFRRSGLVKVYCRIHSHMSASVLVLDHDVYAVPELDGTFTLPAVPAGAQTVVGWHERIGERATVVQVQAGRTTTLDVSLPVEEGP